MMKRWRQVGYLLIGILLVSLMAIARPVVQLAWGQPVGYKPPGEIDVEGDIASVGRSFESIAETFENLPGLFTLYRNQSENSLYLALHPDQLRKNYLCTMTLSSGLGEIFYRGTSLGDLLLQFQQVNDRVQLVVPNIYFRTSLDDPQRQAIDRSFSDSAIASLPIISTNPDDGTLLIDLNQMLVNGSDVSNLSSIINILFGGSYARSPDASYIDAAASFPQNVEVDVRYTFSGSNILFAPASLPSGQAFSLNVNYSFLELPADNGYRPRLADEQVGYFIDAYQDLSNLDSAQPFVRNIQRWHLEKQNPDLFLSPPKEPIVFWIENTVPLEYRDAIRDGVLMWNDAFEEAGFENAIEVRQMPDDADWEPSDIRYNTIRWSNSLYTTILGMAIPHTNPLTGQILDADVLLDANVVRIMRDTSGFLAQQQQALGEDSLSLLNPQRCNPLLAELYAQWAESQPVESISPDTLRLRQDDIQGIWDDDVCFSMGLAYQGAIGSLALATLHNALPSGDTMDVFVHQFLAFLTAHEVGHALGLRHNFRASTMLAPDEINDVSITRERGLAASVMDYTPANLAPVGTEQGDYFSTTVGPYDKWAIAYGYTPLEATLPFEEQRELDAIVRRFVEPGLDYGTDEDAFDFLNTFVNLWDLTSNPLQYAQWQLDNARAIWDKLPSRYPLPGESYSELRDRFDVVLNHYFGQVFQTLRYVGGQVFSREPRRAGGDRLPFEAVPLEQQREALQVLNDYVFSEDAFNFSPDLISQLAPSRWFHWGASPMMFRLDYPVYDTVLEIQSVTLSNLLSSERLNRIRDAELSYPDGTTMSMPELFETLHQFLWTEVIDSDDQDASITSIRRGLQRQHLSILSNMALRNTNATSETTNFLDTVVAWLTLDAPDDARTLARYQLRQLHDEVRRVRRRHDDDMDTLTLAHLEDIDDRIAKVIDAPLRSR